MTRPIFFSPFAVSHIRIESSWWCACSLPCYSLQIVSKELSLYCTLLEYLQRVVRFSVMNNRRREEIFIVESPISSLKKAFKEYHHPEHRNQDKHQNANQIATVFTIMPSYPVSYPKPYSIATFGYLTVSQPMRICQLVSWTLPVLMYRSRHEPHAQSWTWDKLPYPLYSSRCRYYRTYFPREEISLLNVRLRITIGMEDCQGYFHQDE